MIVEEGERWTAERIRATHPLDRFAQIYRDGGTTMAFGRPSIPMPLGRWSFLRPSGLAQTLDYVGVVFRPYPWKAPAPAA